MNETAAVWIVLIFALAISLMIGLAGTVSYLPPGIVAGMKALGLL